MGSSEYMLGGGRFGGERKGGEHTSIYFPDLFEVTFPCLNWSLKFWI